MTAATTTHHPPPTTHPPPITHHHTFLADRVKVVQLDVTDDASVAAAVEAVRADLGEGGTLGGLVNNAGWA